MPLESRKLIFPNANLGDDLDDLGCKQIHDVSGTDFRRSEVEAHSTAVSKVAVAITTRHGDNGSAQATEGIYVLNRWQRTAEEMKGRLPITGRSWEAILQPCSGLQRERMKRRRQIGGGEEYSGSAKDNADEALSVGILLYWAMGAPVAGCGGVPKTDCRSNWPARAGSIERSARRAQLLSVVAEEKL